MTTSTYTSKQSSPYSSMSLMHWVFFNPIVLISHSKCHAFICTVSSFLYITNSVEVKRKDWCVVTDQIENDCWMIPQRSVSIMFSVCHTRLCFFFFVFVFVPVFVDVCSADDLCPHWHQVKVMTENELLGYACEQFLGKSVVEIKSVILQTLEGHLRAILGG